jgi:peptide-methionine (S)-S-oxide reductase
MFNMFKPIIGSVAATLTAACLLGVAVRALPAAEKTPSIPAPVVDEQPSKATSDEAVTVLAGGCFWGVQGVYQHVKGVKNAVSGYAGGDQRTAEYETVGTGRTGHAESVQITYNPREISYGQLLQIYFSVAHDPTERNRQGPDVGTQYRSTIFPTTADQARIAKAYIAQLNDAKVFRHAIATTIEPDRAFYPAEGYHQDFLTHNPSNPYIAYNDLPKIDALKRAFPDLYRAEPALVGGSRTSSRR